MPFATEMIAPQSNVGDLKDVNRRSLAEGIDALEGSSDDGGTVLQAVIADADKVSKEDFTKYLDDNGYESKIEDTEEAGGDGLEREDGGKNYRLDDRSDRPQAMFSKPLTSEALEWFPTESDDSKDLHVLKAGPLYDLDGGEMVLDLSEEQLQEIASTTQAIIDAGHALPVSFEHGIEAGFRGDPSADRRPYGEIMSVYYDQNKKGIYARKRWTKLGRDIVEASMMEDDRSALRVSPRVRFTPAYHPDNGVLLGDSGYIDVVSITSLPRQAQVERVALNRAPATGDEIDQENSEVLIQSDQNLDKIDTGKISTTGLMDGGGTATPEDQGHKGCNMAESKQAEIKQTVDVLLGRGTDEANRIIEAVGIGQDVDGLELARHVESMKNKIEKFTVELGRYKAEEDARELARRETEADELLNSTELDGAEREFYRAALLGGDDAADEFARKAIAERGRPDQLVKVNDAVEAAKQRGSIAADFALTDETKELARENADVVVKLFESIPAGMVIRVGEPAGSDSAGLEAKVTSNLDASQAEEELSRLAKKIFREGKTETRAAAWNLARTERGDLDAVVNGE